MALEEIVAFIIDHDEGREILHLDFANRFHAQLGEIDDIDLGDIFLGEDRAAIENPTINKEAVDKSVLQVGSFQSAGEADSLKAQLALLGLEASVKSAVVNNETWHRVQLGPFASESSLSRAKNLLIENKIKYMQRNLQ